MKRNLLLGIVRDRNTGETFDIAVPADSFELALKKLSATPNLELLLDERPKMPPRTSPVVQSIPLDPAATPARR